MTTPPGFRGQAIGLPQEGAGSLAAIGPRVGAFVVDALASSLVAALLVPRHGAHSLAQRLPGSWSLLPLALDYVLGILLVGRTLGMYLFGLRIVRVGPAVAVDPLRALGRTALLFLLVPAVVLDRDGRGLHDRLTDTAVVRAGQ